ncbi:MAG: DNA-directed RNA polymerase subunit alpha [Endomicrobiia bacterium]
MEKLLLPQNFEDIKVEKNKYGYENYGKFAIYPFERGFGHTIGNSLRRILLSSLEGAAITNCRINNVLHEFTSIPGVKEDIIYILMNLKKIRFKVYSEGPEIIRLHVKGSKEKTIVTAGDFETNHNVEIINKDEYIAEIDSRAELKIEAEVEKGRGYVLSEVNKAKKANKPVGTLFIDSIFSPIIKVNYEVEDVRVGEKTNYDKLIIEIWSDGSIFPKDALIFAAKILKDNLDIFFKASTKSIIDKIAQESDFDISKQERLKDLLSQSIDILELSNRPRNCLKNAKIETIQQLVSMTEEELKALQNLGEKSLEEIKQKLKEKDLYLGMKL